MRTLLNYYFIILFAIGLTACTQDKIPNIPVELKTIKVGKFPHSLSFGKNHNQLFVSCFAEQTISEIDLTESSIINKFTVLQGPSQLIQDKNYNRLYGLHNKQNGFAVIQFSPSKLIRTAQTGRLNLAGGCTRPGSNELWVSDGQTKILVFTRGLALKKNITVGRYPQHIVFTQEGNQALVTLKGENAIGVIDTQTYKLDKKINVGIYPLDIMLIGNKACISNFGSHDISIVDIVNAKEIKRLPVKKRPNALAYKNNTLWVACEKSFYLMAINIKQEQVIGRIRTGFFPGDLVARNDGSLIVTSPRQDKIAIINPLK